MKEENPDRKISKKKLKKEAEKNAKISYPKFHYHEGINLKNFNNKNVYFSFIV